MLKSDRYYIWSNHCILCGLVHVCVLSFGELSVCVSRQPVISWH